MSYVLDKPNVDNGVVDDLKRQLEEALAAKTEAEAKLELIQGRSGTSDNSGKLDPSLLNKIHIPSPGGVGAPPPPPMPGMSG